MGAGASSKAPPRYKWYQDHTLRGPWTFLVKEKVQCACEGSKWCTRENPTRQRTPNAFPGLHSSWVGDKVLAMARPWQAHVVDFKLVEAFQRAKIGMILNLQEVGEHASCGPGNLPHTGFTYDPETFMAGGVGYYNFAWRDMGVPSLDRMMDIVQVMDYVTRVEGRKIAVHCHAGLGRTGLAIACFFVFAGLHDSPEAAIAAVRRNRPGAVQTRSQVDFVTIFAQYLQYLRCVYPHPLKGPPTRHTARQGKGDGRDGLGQPHHHHHSSSAASLADVGADGGGGGSRSLSTQSAPVGALPSDGLLKKKETGTAVVGLYSSGLTVTLPLLPGPGGGGGGDGDALTEADLGVVQHLPWNDLLQIQPQHAADFRPQPPKAYREALSRQARLLHGPERRAYLHLHKLVKEAAFAIIAAAQAFQPVIRAPTQSHKSLPAILEDEQQAQQDHAKSIAAIKSAVLPDGGDGGGGAATVIATDGGRHPGDGSPKAPSLPLTFAHLMSYLIAHHGPNHVNSDALAPLMTHKAYAAAVGKQVDSHAVLAAASQLRQEVNGGQYGGLNRAPLLVVLLLLESFFSNLKTSTEDEPSSLTSSCLSVISKSYQELFNGQMPAPPSSRPSTAETNGPGANGTAAATATANGTATTVSLEYARQAYEILEPLDPRDSELLLVFAAMLRVVARGSGPGSEEAVVELGKWTTGLLLGRLSRLPEAEEAVLSFLWYLAGRDEAYAMLVLLKRQRVSGLPKRSRPGAGGVDVAAMLQAATASLVAATAAAKPPPPPPPTTPASPSGTEAPDAFAAAGSIAAAAAWGGGGAGDIGSGGSITLVAPMRPEDISSSTEGGSTLSSPAGGAASVSTAAAAAHAPAMEMVQLLSQDLQQLYRVSFREVLASLPSVVYPPPVASGRIDVHDVWR